VTEAGDYGDALSRQFWAAAAARRLVLQRCSACGGHQFYPRPLCLVCESSELSWIEASGRGRVYSMTTVHVLVLSELPPPYVVAVVELDEGPRLTTNLIGGTATIGDRVRVAWRERDGMPPLPVFEPVP
jgi:uncharacterized OB-fold protein